MNRSGSLAADRPQLAKLAIALCLPEVVSTGILWILAGAPDSRYLNSVIILLTATALPAFLVAAYAGPLLLIFAGLVVARAVRLRSNGQAGVAGVALVLGILSLAFFYRAVMWLDLPLP